MNYIVTQGEVFIVKSLYTPRNRQADESQCDTSRTPLWRIFSRDQPKRRIADTPSLTSLQKKKKKVICFFLEGVGTGAKPNGVRAQRERNVDLGSWSSTQDSNKIAFLLSLFLFFFFFFLSLCLSLSPSLSLSLSLSLLALKISSYLNFRVHDARTYLIQQMKGWAFGSSTVLLSAEASF